MTQTNMGVDFHGSVKSFRPCPCSWLLLLNITLVYYSDDFLFSFVPGRQMIGLLWTCGKVITRKLKHSALASQTESTEQQSERSDN